MNSLKCPSDISELSLQTVNQYSANQNGHSEVMRDSAGNEELTDATRNEEFIYDAEIDEDVDDAIEEGYMDMECTLERGFSLNESEVANDIRLERHEKMTTHYKARKFPQKYSSALKQFLPVQRLSKRGDEAVIDKVGLLSLMTFSWIGRLMWKAHKRDLTSDDLPECSKFDMCNLNFQRLQHFWSEEVKTRGLQKAQLHRPVWRFIRTRILLSIAVLILTLTFGFLGPTIFMRCLIAWISTNDPYSSGIFWALGLIFCEFLRIISFGFMFALNYRTAIRLKTACLGLVYNKLLKMSNLGNKNVGQVINLFANDSQRVYEFVLHGPMVIGGPLVAIGAIVFIICILGPWALLGMMSFLIFYPLQFGLSRLTGYLRKKTVTLTDERVNIMNELLSYIKLIKMYAWEESFTKSITDVRDRERKYLEKAAYVHSLSLAMAPTVPVLAAVVTFLVHVSAGYNLTPAQGLSVMALLLTNVRSSLNMVRFSLRAIVEYLESQKRIQAYGLMGVMVRVRGMLQYVPNAVMGLTDFWITLKRLKGFLLMNDMESYVQSVDSKYALQLEDVTLSWNRILTVTEQTSTTEKHQLKKATESSELLHNSNDFVDILRNLQFRVLKGELIGICGAVGAGKSSLLLGLLGQMHLSKGEVLISGSCAYVGQQAWILNATLRENILLGEPFVAKRYYKVIYACNLTSDITSFPGGDNTEIGEKGVNLSGGQKQRVALARALYANKDIYLLDDCLSAVDAHVGQHIFQWVIRTALHRKTVLFVSHQLQYLTHCDKIIVMQDGRIIETGTHDELLKREHEYFNMYKKHMEITKNKSSQSNKKDEEKEVSRSRSASITPRNSVDKSMEMKADDGVNHKGQLMTEEKIEKGRIPSSVYKYYIQYAGGYIMAALVILSFALNVGSTAFSSWWLSHWLNAGSGNRTAMVGNTTVTVISGNITDNPDVEFYKLIYGISIIFIFGTSLIKGFAFMKAAVRASSKMHFAIFCKIIRSPVSFFDTNPSGRILNIFSRDMDEVDVRLPITMEAFIQNVWLIFVSLVFVSLVFPYFMIFLLILCPLFLYIRHIYRNGIRDFKRLENVSRSPLYSYVSTTVNGLSNIQAYQKQEFFRKQFMLLFDESCNRLYLFHCAIRWLGIRLDLIALCCTGVTAFLSLILRERVGAAFAGLALAYATQLSGIFQFTVRLSTETEARFTSVHRIMSYIKSLSSEAPLINPSKRPNPHWPKFGRIAFKRVNMRYREDTPLILKGVSFNIDSQEKIGVVGRTGAGKSSLSVALFRLVQLDSGSICIDGLDISTIGLQDLRSHLSIIPQDPVLFIGTVRYNLDPFGQYSDEVIWKSLEKTYMKHTILALDSKLESPIIENGENFSVGEKQLLCLARALLRNSKIIFLDEATAGIDTETDSKVQTTLREAFENCTMITVAHRLNTVMSSSRVLVMDSGKVVEFDSPEALLSRPNSFFSSLVQAAEKGSQIL